MDKVGTYLSGDRGWLDQPAAAALSVPPGLRATALEDKEPDPIDVLKARLARGEAPAGKGFTAGASREGVSAFGDMVTKVDFPKFVGGLIQNVFQAIVDASIQQMQAYGELLAATAKTVDQFASDHISDAQVRDHVANRYPSAVQIDTTSGTPRLRPMGDSEFDVGAAFNAGSVDLTDDDSEQQLVNAAKLDMARGRQQLMATMVLLGINRIVVTDGHINAKVLFEMHGSDVAHERSKAQLSDKSAQHANASTGWLTNLAGGYDVGMQHETTVSNATDDSSESKAAVKAQLSGDVRVAFKSETFPLERMVDVFGMQQLNEKSKPTSAPHRAAAPLPVAAPPVAAPAAAPAAATPGATK
jgi:hypothetical protein